MAFSQLRHLLSNWIKQNDIHTQNGQWCSSQMGHLMLHNWSRQLLIRLGNNLGLPTYQLTYLHTYPPTILQTYLCTQLLLPTYHPTSLHTHLPSYILTYPPTSYFPPTIIHPYIPPTSYFPTHLPTQLLTSYGLQATYLPTLLPTKHHATYLLIT